MDVEAAGARKLTRNALIEKIRNEVRSLVDDEHSFCEVAGRLGIHCRGFKQYTDDELAHRYRWIVKSRAPSREQLEDLANRWQLARQLVQNCDLSCDVQAKERDTCAGWDGFDDRQLSDFHRQLSGETVEIEA